MRCFQHCGSFPFCDWCVFNVWVIYQVYCNLNWSIWLWLSHSKRRRLDVLTEKSFPSYISPEINKKDKLYNMIVKKNLGWMDPLKYGKPFVVDLCNLLWFIDGHHDVFASRSCPTPLFFSTFVGYNLPELSKHRCRSVSNMSHENCWSMLQHCKNMLPVG